MAHVHATAHELINRDAVTVTASEALDALRADWKVIAAGKPSKERSEALRAIESSARAVQVIQALGMA